MGAGRTPPGGYPPPVGTVPMLSRVPAGELMDSPRRAPVRRTAEVLSSDTSWRPCQIVAWARPQGGWAALIRWPDGREDWRQFNRRHMRPKGHGDPGLPSPWLPRRPPGAPPPWLRPPPGYRLRGLRGQSRQLETACVASPEPWRRAPGEPWPSLSSDSSGERASASTAPASTAVLSAANSSGSTPARGCSWKASTPHRIEMIGSDRVRPGWAAISRPAFRADCTRNMPSAPVATTRPEKCEARPLISAAVSPTAAPPATPNTAAWWLLLPRPPVLPLRPPPR